MAQHHELGKLGEDFAANFLMTKGFKIIFRNWRCRHLEVDIVAMDANTLVFVEVKTRHSNSMTTASEAVDKRKQLRIIKTASAYLLENDTEKYCRFDVCEVYVDKDSLKLESINYIENAFELEDGYAGC